MDAFDINKFTKKLKLTGGSDYLSRMPLYECIRRTLQEMIVSGEIPDGCQLPSDKIFAKALGINHITLGKALNEIRQCGLLIRNHSGTFVHSPSQAEINISGTQEKLVSVIFDDVTSGTFQSELFVAVHNALVANNLEMLFSSSAGHADAQFAGIRSMLLKPNCCGCLVWSIMNAGQVKELMRIKPRNFPLIILDKNYSAIAYDSVLYDIFDAARKVGTYYLKQGYQKLAFVGDSSQREFMEQRIAGLRSVLRSAEDLELIYYEEKDTIILDKYEEIPLITANLKALNWLYQTWQSDRRQARNSIPVATFGTRNDLLPPLPVLEVIFSSEEVGYKSVELLVARLHGDQSNYQKHLIKGIIREPVLSTELVIK
ncbi:MAG: GntR family transcriptional regulator [Victivallaceae bacterium]|jgi:DNA-binding LacI/PurR family transcriptional regulator